MEQFAEAPEKEHVMGVDYLENDLQRPKQRLGDGRSSSREHPERGQTEGIPTLDTVSQGPPPLAAIFLTAPALQLHLVDGKASPGN